MARPLNEFSGNAIYLDTMLPYMLLRGMGETVQRFFQRLERGEFIAYTSVLTFDELAYRMLLAFVRDTYGGSPLDRLREDEEQILREFAPRVAQLLTRIQLYRSLRIIDASVTDLDAMSEAMSTHHLRPRDAFHFATMQRVRCLNLASTDHHFDLIPSIQRFAL